MSKYKLIGKVLYIIYRFLNFFTKKEYYKSDEYLKNENSQGIYVFWHRKIFTVCNMTRPITKKASMVSSSKDGEILSELLRLEGNELIRGSSRNDNIKSLKEAIKYSKRGYNIGIAIDGPRGPIYEPKPGAIFIAKKLKIKIIPLGTYSNKVWIFEKMWDKLEIPKPFSKCVHYFGDPITLDENIEICDGIEIIKNKIHDAELKAKEIYFKKYVNKE